MGDPFSIEEVAEQAKVKDMVLGGIEAELKALQNEVLNPRDPGGRTSTSPTVPGGKTSPAVPGKTTKSEPPAKSQAESEIEDLLKLDSDLPDDSSLLTELEQQQQGSESADVLASEWNNFSAFMPATRNESGGSKSPLSGWEQELMGSTGDLPEPLPPMDVALVSSEQEQTVSSGKEEAAAPSSSSSVGAEPNAPLPSSSVPTSSDPGPHFGGGGGDHTPNPAPSNSTPLADNNNDPSIDKLLGLTANSADAADLGGGMANELLSKELNSLGISSTVAEMQKPSASKPANSTPSSSDISSIDSSLFGLHSAQPNLPLPSSSSSFGSPGYPVGLPAQQFRSPLGPSQGPPVYPTHGAMGMVMAPPKFGLVSGGNSGAPTAGAVGGAMQQGTPPAVVGGAAKEGGGAKEEKGKTWMNFFAHLDPLVNEKA